MWFKVLSTVIYLGLWENKRIVKRQLTGWQRQSGGGGNASSQSPPDRGETDGTYTFGCGSSISKEKVNTHTKKTFPMVDQTTRLRQSTSHLDVV